MPISPLSAQARDEALQQMARRELDVLVIGGGVVGAGTALDAVTRGLSTGMVEANDWASGTSSRSSKLIHGGLRYLEMLDFGLVREALRERDLLLTRLAPHLVHPVPFLYPLLHRGWERPYVGAGMLLYDALATTVRSGRSVPRHRHLSRRGALLKAPCLRPDALTGAIQYWDAQVDDARHTLTVVRTAVSFGAMAANGARVTNLLRDGARVVGAQVLDVDSGRSIDVRARQVISSTGVWTGDTLALSDGDDSMRVRASKGIHLVVPRDRINSATGLILRTEASVLFVIPWGRHWILGTTDTAWDLDKAHPAASAADIDFVLDRVNSVLTNPITHRDIEGVYVGLRPLLAGDAATTKLSREHAVARVAPGLVAVAGGKFTTYRVMAADAVDEAVGELSERVPASCTADVPLAGAEGYQASRNQRRQLAAALGTDVDVVDRLLHRYGSLVTELVEAVRDDPALAEPLSATDYLRVEAHYAVTHEGARHLDDVLTRRTRISIETWDRGELAAQDVGALMATLLGWSAERQREEVMRYLARVAAERAANEACDDASANAARVATNHPSQCRR